MSVVIHSLYAFKGFASHAQFTNNTPGIISPIGELSTQSLTYAREKGLYKSSLNTAIDLTAFLSTIDSSPFVLTTDMIDQIVTMVDRVYATSISTQGVVFADQILEDLLQTYQAQADTFDCGDIVNDGHYYIPEWISFRSKTIDSLASNNTIKIWLSDPSFQAQYDEYEIVVVAPVLHIDDFFMVGAAVGAELTSASPSETMIRVQDAKNNYPETIVRAETYNYIDPMNNTHQVPSTWYLLIYGIAGDNIDAINDALINYILSNSEHTRDEWTQLLPDLFRRTEFVMVPLWDQYSIPNRVALEAGIYSPVVSFKEANLLVKQVVTAYLPAHIDEHLTVMGHPYKSLAVTAIGSIDNRQSLFEITDVFPDIIAVASTSLDFNRMTQNTQNWSILLAQMIIVAESMGDFTGVPVGMMKMRRDGILYLVARFGNIHYLVAAKKNFPLPPLV